MEKTLATHADHDTIYDSFDAMNLKEDLLRGIYQYGYKKPSVIQQRGIVPFSEGVNLVLQGMWGPGRTSTYCIGVLQRLDIDLHKCQCLILAFGGGEVREIAAAMQKLGQFLGVKVFACLGIADDISKDTPHVVVGSPNHVLRLLAAKELCSEGIKMVVLDEVEMQYNSRVLQVYEIIDYLVFKTRNQVQIGAFCETMPTKTAEKIANKTRDEPLVILAQNRHELSLDGIKKHKFVNVEKEDLKGKELCMIINKIQEMVPIIPIMVFVSTPTKLNSLKKDLDGTTAGYPLPVTRCCMDQKERDATMKEFLQFSRVILTTRLWSRGIIEECIDKACFIVNYDICDRDAYIKQLGWFRNVDAAISFATNDDWDNLVWLQQEYNIVIGRFEPSQIQAQFLREETVKVSTIKEAPIEHFIFDVGDEEGKVDALLGCEGGLYGEFDIAGTSVIFVNCSDQIPLLAVKLDSKYTVFTSKDNWLHDVDTIDATRPCIFITTDEGIDVKVKVHLIVNFDVPLEQSNYRRRLDWCQSNGIFLLLGTQVDWFKVLDMQALYRVFITWLPSNVPDILKEMVLTGDSLPTSKKRQIRGK